MTYIKKKIPWWKIGFIALVIVLIIAIASFLFPELGKILIGGIMGGINAIYVFFFVEPTWISVVAAVGITATVLILITQRKYFFKQKLSDYPVGATPALQGAPIQQQAFTNQPAIQQLVTDKDTEVSS